ncbi:hypothetical protein E4U54_006976 [Claviceps lovelessii]|nr:hypothetical protein E4U54_006976 [Claviceps lovelessii]
MPSLQFKPSRRGWPSQQHPLVIYLSCLVEWLRLSSLVGRLVGDFETRQRGRAPDDGASAGASAIYYRRRTERCITKE